MPAIAKTSDARVLAAARRLVEQRGADALSMQALGERVGVRAPSLYKRFPHRDAILDGVLAGVLEELGALLRDTTGPSPEQTLRRMAQAYRAFSHRRPHLYALMFARRPTGETVARLRGAAVAPLLETLVAWRGADDALPAARTLVAWLHGFVSMELEGAFRLGGDVEAAFAFGLQALLRALSPR